MRPDGPARHLEAFSTCRRPGIGYDWPVLIGFAAGLRELATRGHKQVRNITMNAPIRFPARRGGLLVLLLWGIAGVSAGCSEPTVKFDVQVNQRADLGAVQSVAVLEFGWTPPGARRVQPTYYQSRSRPARTDRKTATPADEGDFQKSRSSDGDARRTAPPLPQNRDNGRPAPDDDGRAMGSTPKERMSPMPRVTDAIAYRRNLAPYDDDDDDEDDDD